jgi:hypothetical protein
MNLPPTRIFAHNILSAHIGRTGSGTPIFDESALIATHSFAHFHLLLRSLHGSLLNLPSPTDEGMDFYLTSLSPEISTLLEAAEVVAYASLQPSPSDFAVTFAGGIKDLRFWLSESDFRLFSFLHPDNISVIPEIIRFIAQEEAAICFRLLTELTPPTNIIILNEPAYNERAGSEISM